MNRFDMTGKWALITGAGGLLGREHSFALAEVGCNIILTDLNTASLETLRKELQELFKKQNFKVIKLDVTNESEISSVLVEFIKVTRRLDVLINNAAIDPKVIKDDDKTLEQSRFENFSLEAWSFQLAVGLTGSMLCAKVFGSHMAENGGGVIVNISSDLSVFAPDQRIYEKKGLPPELQPVKPVTYSVIKHGIIGLTKYLATYWAHKGVRVNALSPGGVYNSQPDEFVQKLSNLIPLGRMANKDEYRGCIQFLSSDASSYMTGQNLIADGGRSVW